MSKHKVEIFLLSSRMFNIKNDLFAIVFTSMIFNFALQSGYLFLKDEQGVYSEDVIGVSSEDAEGI